MARDVHPVSNGDYLYHRQTEPVFSQADIRAGFLLSLVLLVTNILQLMERKGYIQQLSARMQLKQACADRGGGTVVGARQSPMRLLALLTEEENAEMLRLLK